MSQALHRTGAIHTSRKHIVPTHLNLPDTVLTVWSFGLSARQLLLLLVGGGIGGTLWQHLAALAHFLIAGQVLRGLLALLPFLLVCVLACYQHAGRYLEVWLLVLLHSHLRPKRYLWRSIRAWEYSLSPLLTGGEEIERGATPGLRLPERKKP